ncbi:MAG: hypothetical protein HFI76_00325 [Lachnospiraceae bacterium]|nr:hypothetical protein [Lachnospiraceae bacterium]
MKKYLIVSIVLILCGVGWIYVSSRFSLYIRLGGEKPVEAGPFWVEGKEIYHEMNGKQEPFWMRGVNMESFIPGHFVTDYAVGKKQYQEWFGLIQEMGANTVRIPTIYDSGFYDALYSYNKQREQEGKEPLYLLQALWVTDYAQDSREDAYSGNFYGQLQIDMRNAVDVMYGNILLPFAKTRGSGWYRSDVSKWVIGITLGTTWRGDTSAYTNQMEEKPLHVGTWFCASEDASQFENMMAGLLDTLVDYESKRYGCQHLVSIASEPVTDPFDYENLIEVQLEKYDKIDAEHILVQDSVLSGFFISYKLYDFCPDSLEYLSQTEQRRLSHILPGISRNGSYGGYLELLGRYYSVPVIIGDCGYSSSRGITKEAEGTFGGRTPSHGLTEEEQGEALVKLYQECKGAGLSGMMISDWQDNWSQTDWNIYPMTDKEREPFWHNVQSEAQGFGLLSFEPGEEPLVIVDGDSSEWAGEEPFISNEWGNLYVRQDEAYLYLWLERADTWEDMPEQIYIPMDITPNSGSKSCRGWDIAFEREADFLLCLEGEAQGQILVQDYYDSWRAAWNQRIEHVDAYTIDIPRKDSKNFIPIQMVLDSTPVYSADWNLRNAKRADTGRLRFGIADATDREYDSQADFYTVGGCTELRIPWALLNFQDPSRGVIHDDYYQHYGIEGQKVNEIYLGFGTSQEAGEIPMTPFSLKSWGRGVAYRQRLKQSYYILQKCWGQE